MQTRWIKQLGWLLLGLVFTFVLGVAYLLFWFDPNAYRDELNALLSRTTQENVVIHGAMKLQFIPRFELGVQDIRVQGRVPFDKQPLATIDRLGLQLSLLPLLHHQLHIHALHIRGLQLHLQQSHNRNNWAHLVSANNNNRSTTTTTTATNQQQTNDFTIDQLIVEQASITLTDDTAATGDSNNITETIPASVQPIWQLTIKQLHASLQQTQPQLKIDAAIHYQDKRFDETLSLRANITQQNTGYLVDDITLHTRLGSVYGDFTVAHTNTAASTLWQRLALKGNFKAGPLSFEQLTLDSISISVNANNGVWHFAPITAHLYGGDYLGDIQVDLRNQALPTFDVKQKINGLKSQDMFNVLAWQSNYISTLATVVRQLPISGTMQIDSQVRTQGNDKKTLLYGLEGYLRFAADSGNLSGLDGQMLIAQGLATLAKQPFSATNSSNNTPFATLSGSLHFAQGIASNNDLLLVSPLLQISGQGQFDLLTQAINYHMQGAFIKRDGKLDQTRIPFLLHGTFAEPKFNLDVPTLLGQQIHRYRDRLKEQMRKVFGDDVLKALE